MKRNAFFSATLILSLFLLQTAAFAQKKDSFKTVKLQTSAHTEMCKAKIEKTLAYEKGIIESELDRESQILTVKYNPDKTDVKKIIIVITSLGHDAIEITETREKPEGQEKQQK
jgi:mercuric ion binding protein